MSTPTPQLVMTRLNVTEARSEALFDSELRPSDAPTAEVVAKAIDRAVQLYCVGRMAQDLGDHPDAAAERMRWARWITAQAAVRP